MRSWTVIATVLAGHAAHADGAKATTLEPTKLAIVIPEDWKLLSDRAGDFLHHDIDEARTIDVSFERVTDSCKTWRAAPEARKEFPAYWPKKARTHLYTQQGDGKLEASGCLADTPSGALLVHLEVTAQAPKWRPSKADIALMKDVLTAAHAGAAVLAGRRDPLPPTELKPNAHRGGTAATLPRLDFSIKLPKGAVWIVGNRGETRIERDDPDAASLAVSVFTTPFRTCSEWRVDGSSSDVAEYHERAGYLPATAKLGAFAAATVFNQQITTCLDTKSGPLGVAIEYANGSGPHALVDLDAILVRGLIDAIAVGANKHKKPLFSGTPVLEAGAVANATIGNVKLPAGASWRVTNGTVERFDQGKYFAVSSMSRASCATKSEASEQPFWPAGIKARVEERAWGTTVSQACIAGTRELTLVYDGKISAADHALIRSLIEAFVAKKATPKS